MNVTPKQLQILNLIRDCRLANGYSPTMQELADQVGVSKVTVFEHVEALIRKGIVAREPNKARSLSIRDESVLPDEEHTLSWPLLGRIAAGMPIQKFQQDDQLEIEHLFGARIGDQGGTFALQVEGESMRDEGILDGDYVLVQRASTAKTGQRVIALLPDGETTLKSFFREPDGRIRLQPANPDFKPIIVEDCQIQGIVIGVMRRY